MKDDITIPPAALEAGKDTAFNWLRGQMDDDVRVQHMTDDELTELVSAVCLAMLKAWPGMKPELDWDAWLGEGHTPARIAIILPLPQKGGSDDHHH